MKKNLSTILLVAVLIVGVGLLVYPSLSDYWNSFHQTRAIASYSDAVSTMDTRTTTGSGAKRRPTTPPWRKRPIPTFLPKKIRSSMRTA